MSAKKYLDETGLARVKSKIDTKLANKMDAIELTSPVRIWDLDAGKIYKIPKNCVIYYYGATNTSNSFTMSADGFLFMSEYSTTYKGFFILALSSTTRYIYNGYSSSSSGTYSSFNLGGSYLTSMTYASAYCTTSASTSAKIASCTGYTLTPNTWLHILIQNANSYNGALTLNVNNKGSKPIYINGEASSSSNKTLPAGTYLVYYDGTNYYFRTDGKLTASITGDAATVNGKTVGVNVPSDAVFTDTTYESKAAASGGTAVSLVTTGEKYTWNNKASSDTKNTAGSTDTSSKIYLVGAKSQAANPQTYSQDTAYVGTDGHLYSNSKQVVNLSDTQALTNKTYNGYTLGDACAKGVDTSINNMGSTNVPITSAVVNHINEKTKIRRSKMILTGPLSSQSIVLNLNATYEVDSNDLEVYFNGEKLIKAASSSDTDGHYAEVGSSGSASASIKLVDDWYNSDSAPAAGDYFEFILRGN